MVLLLHSALGQNICPEYEASKLAKDDTESAASLNDRMDHPGCSVLPVFPFRTIHTQ